MWIMCRAHETLDTNTKRRKKRDGVEKKKNIFVSRINGRAIASDAFKGLKSHIRFYIICKKKTFSYSVF